ncbi:hypothetical protein PR202_ga08162 [Eleusine coracana subsp. coracana]|uniref:Expansin n=1 Tax=Eleusine coracana subsp. coracana TaxID=191504 RepID=A0AAV5BZG3_ELECO|nr:hypothetical protein PR202_ga08162 [Eleusine coracana subsp. coracana]
MLRDQNQRATSFCPPSYNYNYNHPPRPHFELSSMPDFNPRRAGIVPITYRRSFDSIQFKFRFDESCLRLNELQGGLREVCRRSFQHPRLPLLQPCAHDQRCRRRARNWGQNWHVNAILVGGELSFRVTTSDTRTLTSWNVAPNTWRFGHTFQAKNNFFFFSS